MHLYYTYPITEKMGSHTWHHENIWKWISDGDIRNICNLYFAYLPQDDPFCSEGMFESTDFQLLAFDLFGIDGLQVPTHRLRGASQGLGLIWESTGLFTDPTQVVDHCCYVLSLIAIPGWESLGFPPARFAARTSCIVLCAVPSQVLVTCRKTRMPRFPRTMEVKSS